MAECWYSLVKGLNYSELYLKHPIFQIEQGRLYQNSDVKATFTCPKHR